MATFKINGKNFATQSGTGEATVHSDVVFPTHHIIQIAQTTKTATETFNNENWTTAISSLNPSFITKKANSKILVETNQFWGCAEGGAEGVGVRLYRNDGTGYAEVTATRDGTLSWSCWFNVPGFSGDDYAPQGVTASFLDSPSVAAGTTLTYAFHPRPYTASYPVYLNIGKNTSGGDTNGRWRPLTSATIKEIAA
tara:strand:+ start:2678 stop:3265 length:588 start_codon:yes stop_codon:yes gene_type:complete